MGNKLQKQSKQQENINIGIGYNKKNVTVNVTIGAAASSDNIIHSQSLHQISTFTQNHTWNRFKNHISLYLHSLVVSTK